MKRNLFTLSAAFVSAAIMFTSCDTAPKGDQAVTAEKQEAAAAVGKEYIVSSEMSVLEFTGNGVGKNHPGQFTITDGAITAVENKVTGGKFNIDINSMKMAETADFINAKLRPHLLSPDFFDAGKFPTARFEITDVQPYSGQGGTSVIEGANAMVSGNLTLKDQTKNISFPARIELSEGQLVAAANFDIDRTQWGMNYGNDESLKDKFISPTVNILLKVVAK